MIDLSQAITSEPDFDKKQNFEPLKWCPPILQQRSAKGKHLEGIESQVLVVGVLTLVGGILILLDAYEVLSLDDEPFPPIIAICFNIFTLIMGTGCIYWGWMEKRKRKMLDTNKLLRPGLPWFWDFDWKQDSVRDDLGEQLFWRAWMIVLALGVFVPVSWLIFFDESTDWKGFYWLIASMFIFVDLILIVAVVLLIYQNLKYFKYGISRLKFLEFPFFPENNIKVQLDNLPNTFSRMTLELRFIEEEHLQSGDNYTYMFFQLFKQDKVFYDVPSEWDGVLLIDWQLPDKEELVTSLNSQPTNYWELEVKAETSGVDYHSRFLLPVYAKP